MRHALPFPALLVFVACGGSSTDGGQQQEVGAGGAAAASGAGGAAGAVGSGVGGSAEGGAANGGAANGGAAIGGNGTSTGGRPVATGGSQGDGGRATGGSAGSAPIDGARDCDPRHVLCRASSPVCPEGLVPEVEGSCWGECVPIDECGCRGPEACPSPETFTCNLSARRCTYYLR